MPDHAADVPRHIQNAVEALAQDGAEYARLYGLPLDRAMRELQAQQASVPATDALQQTYRDRLAGLFIAHDGGFRIVVLLTGSDPVPDQTIVAGGLTIPVTFRTGRPRRATRSSPRSPRTRRTSGPPCAIRRAWGSIPAQARWR